MVEHDGLVYSIARRYARYVSLVGHVDLDDLIQAGRMAVLEAKKTYNPEKSAFSSWAYLYIHKAIWATLGIRWRKGGGIILPPLPASLDAPVDEEGEIPLLDTIASPDALEGWEGLLVDECARAVQHAIDSLPDEMQTIARENLLYLRPLTRVADDLGISIDRAKSVQFQAIRALKKELSPLADGVGFFKTKGVESFMRSRSSAVEDVAFRRMGI